MGDLQVKGYSREKDISDNREEQAQSPRCKSTAQVRSRDKAESAQHRGREGLGGEALSEPQHSPGVVGLLPHPLSHDPAELEPHSVPPTHTQEVFIGPSPHLLPPPPPTAIASHLDRYSLQPSPPQAGCTSEHVSQALPVTTPH